MQDMYVYSVSLHSFVEYKATLATLLINVQSQLRFCGFAWVPIELT